MAALESAERDGHLTLDADGAVHWHWPEEDR